MGQKKFLNLVIFFLLGYGGLKTHKINFQYNACHFLHRWCRTYIIKKEIIWHLNKDFRAMKTKCFVSTPCGLFSKNYEKDLEEVLFGLFLTHMGRGCH